MNPPETRGAEQHAERDLEDDERETTARFTNAASSGAMTAASGTSRTASWVSVTGILSGGAARCAAVAAPVQR
ncbi:MAG: hypothetical protein ACK5LO_09110 [Leucobacter sp.]